MDAGSIYLERHLREKIKEESDAVALSVLNGTAADYPAYKSQTGKLFAYAKVLQMLDDFSLNERDDRR